MSKLFRRTETKYLPNFTRQQAIQESYRRAREYAKEQERLEVQAHPNIKQALRIARDLSKSRSVFGSRVKKIVHLLEVVC